MSCRNDKTCASSRWYDATDKGGFAEPCSPADLPQPRQQSLGSALTCCDRRASVLMPKKLLGGSVRLQLSQRSRRTRPSRVLRKQFARSNRPGPRWRLAASVRLVFALMLLAITVLLLPKTLGKPEDSPGEGNDAVDDHSFVVLFTERGDAKYTNLSWDWSISKADGGTLFATSQSRAIGGYLILAGPVAQSVKDCHLNGESVESVDVAPRTFDDEAKFPEQVRFDLSGRTPGTIRKIAFYGSPDPGFGGNVLHCELPKTMRADDPPVHRLYTPALAAYQEGETRETGTRNWTEESMCVESGAVANVEAARSCATTAEPVPSLYDHEDLITVPQEQGSRDGKLIAVGALAGAAAAALWSAIERWVDARVAGVARPWLRGLRRYRA